MSRYLQHVICLGAFALGTFLSSFGHADSLADSIIETQEAAVKGRLPFKSGSGKGLSRSGRTEVFEHKMQLYLADAYGFEVPASAFWVTLNVIKERIGNQTRVTLQIPSIGFVTGPFANQAYETVNPVSELIDEVPGIFLPPPQNGGYLYTKGGFLPEELRPNEVMPRSYFGASNNGQNIPFNYLPEFPAKGMLPTVNGVSFTPPLTGYMIRLTNAGGLVVEGTGTLGNIIPPGTQQLLATDITYITKPQLPRPNNTQISKGAINVTQYTLPPADNGNVDYVRDHHVNDAWDNVVAYAWADNSNIPNAAANPGEMHLAYAIGTVKNGELKMRPAQFLPTPNNMFVWDTAIAINRSNKNNIVISYLLIDPNSPGDGLPFSTICAAVSYDGGKTFPINGPTNVQPTGFVAPGIPGGAGDVPGVRADKFGNFWYMASNFFDDEGALTNVPFIMASSDQGQTWELIFTFPYDDNNPIALYDYPAFCFGGGDGLGNYGVQIVTDLFPQFALGGSAGFPARAFVPITGLGSFGEPTSAFLPQFQNNIFTASITASEDGRVWTYGAPAGLAPASYPFPGGFTNNRLVFKSPGAIDLNYAGPWGVIRYNTLATSIDFPVWEAAPIFGFFQSVQTNIYDDERQALYVILNATFPELSNDSEIYFLISRDNGLTWSNPLRLNSTNKNNRGFPSMALDRKTGNLLIGWYDCRDFCDGLSFNYWGTVLTADKLDKLVCKIPLSYPIFSVPAVGFDSIPPIDPPAKGKKAGSNGNAGQTRNRVHARLTARTNLVKR